MNIKMLTKQELEYLKAKYRFELVDDKVFVYVNGYNRVTTHELNHNLNITSKVRRITITVDALSYWAKCFIGKHSPIEVQNAMNFLTISYRDIDEESIAKAIKKIATT